MTATIPRIIHQIWKTADLPSGTSESWQHLGADWEWRLWSDADLLTLVQSHYPHLEALYLSYPKNVQRADLGRYLVLDHCGGIYADLDTECLTPPEVLIGDSRIVLCEEPPEHFFHARRLGLDSLYFNGTMAGPAKHPFWAHLIQTVQRCAHAGGRVLESTGPLALTGAVVTYPNPDHLALNSCHLFAPLTEVGTVSNSPRHGPFAAVQISNHLWSGSWWREKPRKRLEILRKLAGWPRQLRGSLRKARYFATRGPHLTRKKAAAQIDSARLQAPLPTLGRVAVLIPVFGAEPRLDRCLQLLLALDYPKDQLSLVFCQGDRRDGTAAQLAEICTAHKAAFRDIRVLTCGADGARDTKWQPKAQLARRAKVRNHLIEHGLTPEDDWALWLNVDVCDYPPDVLRRLLGAQSKVVTPDCRLTPEGPSFDLSAFTDTTDHRDAQYYKHVRRGLFMPPSDYPPRSHLHDLRFLNRVPLTSVGGTMLVAADVHRAGIRFPDIPYDDLLETEGFGRLCHHFGVTPIGLPNLVILHVAA
jgi:hypothetical protein